ncbi:uncharacterized protein KY384_008288 [Bacidia gigantensis]|uniref:uncharacterized protein n=1 Tax=Bacidia gigantensis TaxID=2732470 RepID=UPI001D045206|nr:uncharacterized protein KY384_008288 [Bacidia gigantensis]KAG8526859.1 hypothetical protein KY384_008288 [Bacidia gigantensis]
MASPISPLEVIEIVNFAFQLCKNCKAAKDDWIQVGKEVNAAHSVVQLVQIQVDDRTSIINTLDDKKKTTSKQLGVHVRNCYQALKDVDKALKRYNQMSGLQQWKWAWHGSDEVDDLMANVSSFSTQLDSFVNAVNLKGINAIYQKQKSLRVGIGRIEQALELNGGDTKDAVKNAMEDVERTSKSQKHCEKYKSILEDYAEEVKREDREKRTDEKQKDQRGRRLSSSTLAPPKNKDRPQSAGTATKRDQKSSVKPVERPKSSGNMKPKFTLECWLVQIKSGDALIVSWQFSEKEIQPRGQYRLQQMAKQFRQSKGSKLRDSHDLVGWVVKDRQKAETDPRYLWQPYAAKIEAKGDLSLNMGVEEQAMVIIKRDLTPEEKAKKEAKEKKARAEKEASKKKAKSKADVQKEKEAAKRQTAKDDKTKKETAKRKAEIEKLGRQVEQLQMDQKQKGDGSLKKPINQMNGDTKNKSPSPNPDRKKRKSVSEAKPGHD